MKCLEDKGLGWMAGGLEDYSSTGVKHQKVIKKLEKGKGGSARKEARNWLSTMECTLKSTRTWLDGGRHIEYCFGLKNMLMYAPPLVFLVKRK